MHIPDGELALYAVQSNAIDVDRRAEIEAHLSVCAECQEAHDFFTIRDDDLVEDLRDADTWEPLVGTATYASLMQYGGRIAEEDREAEVLLKDYLSDPIATAWTALVNRRKHLTGGVVRKLNAAAHNACESQPRVALTFADAAISVAESLPDDLYPARAVHRLRGTAWKERANALMLLGKFPDAYDALARAEREYAKTPHNGLGLAIVALVRAGVLYAQDRLDEAMAMAERAERGFVHSGDEKRRVDAVFLRASIIFESGDPHTATSIFRSVIEYGENASNAHWIALGSYAAANCEVDRGNLGEASALFHRAIVIFREFGPTRERLLTEWGIARVIFHGGKVSAAIRRMRDIAAEFEAGGMVTYAALVGLDICDGLLMLERHREIVTLAQHMFVEFTNARMLTGALTAIAYLKEAAAAKRLRKRDIEAVRLFLHRVERQPSLRFVPPPSVE